MPQQQICSEAVQDILTRVPHWMILYGNMIIFILVLLFFGLSWIIKYPDVIASEALITSTIPPQKKIAPITSKIDTLLVTDHQKVNKKTPLLVLENNARFHDVFYLKSIIDTIQIKESQFSFPVEKIPLLSLGEVNTAFALFESDYINYQLNKELNPYANKKTANQFSVNQIQLRIQNMETQKKLEKKSLSFAKNELDRHKKLFERGVISKQEYESQEIKHLTNERNFANLDVSISQLKQNLIDAHRNSNENRISNKMESTRLFKNAVQSFNGLKEAIKDWERSYILRSDIPGKVSYMGVFHKNKPVKQGELLFSIVPDESGDFTAKIKAPIQNSGKIKVNQKVNIKLFNYPETEYGILQGTVDSMSAIPDTEGFYLVNVLLDKTLTTSYNIKIPFKSEMNGTAEIITEDLRLLERFFYQLRGIFS